MAFTRSSIMFPHRTMSMQQPLRWHVKGRGLAHPFPAAFLQRGVCAERLADHEPMLFLWCAHRARTAKRHWHGPMTRPWAIQWRGAFGVGDWRASRSRDGCNSRAAATGKMRGTSHIASKYVSRGSAQRRNGVLGRKVWDLFFDVLCERNDFPLLCDLPGYVIITAC